MRPISQNFKQRFLVGSALTLFLLITIYFSKYPLFQPFFALMTAGIISMALWEFYQLTRAHGYNPPVLSGILCTFAYIFALYLNYLIPLHNALPEAVLGLTLILTFVYFCLSGHSPFIHLAIVFFGIFYLTIPLGCLFSINFLFPFKQNPDGRLWLVYVMAVTKMTDIGAYIIGKIAGRTHFAPYISPKKTLEGAIGGLAVGIVTSLVYSPLVNMHWIQSLWMGAVTSALAQFGDLSESLLKRDMGVKDSNQLPGLGGVLDILDSLVFAAPFVYIVLKVIYL